MNIDKIIKHFLTENDKEASLEYIKHRDKAQNKEYDSITHAERKAASDARISQGESSTKKSILSDPKAEVNAIPAYHVNAFEPETFAGVKTAMDTATQSVKAAGGSAKQAKKLRQGIIHYAKDKQHHKDISISAARSEAPPREGGKWGGIPAINRDILIKRNILEPSNDREERLAGTEIKIKGPEARAAQKLDVKTAELQTGARSKRIADQPVVDVVGGTRKGQTVNDLDKPKWARKKERDSRIKNSIQSRVSSRINAATSPKPPHESIDTMISNIMEAGGNYHRPKGTEKRYSGFITNRQGKTRYVVNKAEKPGGTLLGQQVLTHSDRHVQPTKAGPRGYGQDSAKSAINNIQGGGSSKRGDNSSEHYTDIDYKERKEKAANAGEDFKKIVSTSTGNIDLGAIAKRLGIPSTLAPSARTTPTPRAFAKKEMQKLKVKDYVSAGEDMPINTWGNRRHEELRTILKNYMTEITTPSLGFIKFGPRAAMPNREPLSTENHPTSLGKRGSGFKPTVEVSGHKEEAEKQLDTLFPAFRTERKEPTTGRDAFNSLFPQQEDNMSKHDKLADKLIAEALTSGPNNVTKGNDNSGKGETARQMLAGELAGGSVAWPYQQPDNKEYSGVVELMNDQAEEGLGEKVSLSQRVAEAVDEMLEDSASPIYTDPESVGYLINALSEEGFTEFSEAIEEITAAPIDEDVARLTEMAKALQEKKADNFLVEQVNGLALLVKQVLTEEEEPEIATAGESGGDAAGSGKPETDAGMDKPAETPGTAD